MTSRGCATVLSGVSLVGGGVPVLVAPVAEPGHVERLRVVLVVHLDRLVVVGDPAVLAGSSLELAAGEVDVGVGPGAVPGLLLVVEGMVAPPLSHVRSVAVRTPRVVPTVGLVTSRARADHRFTVTQNMQVRGMFVVEHRGNRATDSRLTERGKRVLGSAGGSSFHVGTRVRVSGFVYLDSPNVSLVTTVTVM